MQRHGAVLDVQPVDGQHVGIEPDGEIRRLHAAGCVQSEAHARPGKMHLGRPPFAAQQGAERKFEAERLGFDRVRAGADLDVVQGHTRRRQQARVDCAHDAHIGADQMTGFRLDHRAVIGPIDKQRRNQRRHQRQNDRDRQSKQSRLQRQPQRRAKRPCIRAYRNETVRYFCQFLAAILCRRRCKLFRRSRDQPNPKSKRNPQSPLPEFRLCTTWLRAPDRPS